MSTFYSHAETLSKKSKKTLSLLFFLIASVSYSQTGPGGIGNSATNPLWLDAHTMGGTNGAAISSWTDYSGNNISAAQPITTKQPTFVTGAINNKDAIDFNGAQNMICGATATMNNVLYFDWYIVSEIDNFTTLAIPVMADYGSTTAMDVFAGMLVLSGVTSSFSHNASGALVKANFPVTSGPNLYQGIYNRTAHTVTSNTNFSFSATNTNNYYNTATHEGFYIGGKNTAYQMNGRVPEIFVFNFVLNSAQQKILQNYVGAKYAITIANDMYAYQASHDLCVIGIGQDNASNLHSDSQGNGVVRINTPSSLSDGDYLFTGHDDVPLTSYSTDFPASISNGTRLERTWRVSKTGDVGTVNITFDLDASTDFSAANPSEYRLLVDSDGIFSTSDQVLAGTYNAGTHSILFTNVSLAEGNYFTLAGETPEDVHSIASGDWSDPSTWDCNCIPFELNNVFIDPSHVVEVDVDAACLSLTVDASAQLTMNSGSNLDVHGDIDLLGSFTAGSGQISMTGTIPQTFSIGGGSIDLNDFLINNTDPAGVSLAAGQYILNGTLTIQSGLLDLSALGGQFIINSTTGNTEGRIAAIPVGGQITGTVSVRRFIPAGPADWRDIASPVTGATFLDWDASMSMSGDNFPDGCSAGFGDNCFESVKYTKNSTEIKVFNVTDPITNGRGYNVFFGDDLVSFSGGTITSTGTVNGSANIVASYNTGWQTIGNPYVSPMLYSSTTRLSPISNWFYVYDATIGDYQWYDGTTGTSSIPELANGMMAIGQGVWIYVNSLATITYHQSDKTSINATYIKSSEEKANQSLSLNLKQNESTYQTSILFDLHADANDGLDSLSDMRHLETGLEAAPRLYIICADEALRKNYIKDDKRNKSFDLQTKIKASGYYTFELSSIPENLGYRSVVLFDKETNEFIDLKSELSYTFYSDVFDGHRFTLILTNELTESGSTVQSLTLNELSDGMTITQMGHTFNIEVDQELNGVSQISVFNILGQSSVYSNSIQFVKGSNLITLPVELKGVHILTITSGGENLTKKVVL